MGSAFIRSIKGLYPANLERRLKVCPYCGYDYSDVTQRSTGKCCSRECTYAYGANIRNINGSYERTEEQNRKTSESCKRTYAERDVFTPELRKHISEQSRAAWQRGAMQKICGDAHWTKRPEARVRLTTLNTGRVFSPIARQHMSIGARKRLRTKRETHYTSAKGGHRDDIGIYVRSGWEANFARILNYVGKRWSYEPMSFVLSETLSYTPDFYVEDDDVYYELKGRMNERSTEQLRLMQCMHPHVTIIMIGGDEYNALRAVYRNLVQWEGK